MSYVDYKVKSKIIESCKRSGKKVLTNSLLKMYDERKLCVKGWTEEDEPILEFKYES